MHVKQDHQHLINQEQDSEYELLDKTTTDLPGASPKDERFLFIYFLWIGGVSYTSWSAVINSIDYYKAIFPDRSVDFVFPLAPYTASLVMTFVVTYISNSVSYRTRIIVGLIILMIMNTVVPFEASVFQNSDFGMGFTFFLMLIVGLANNLVYASIAGFTSQIAGKYTAYFLMGVAVFGLVMNGGKEIVLLAFDEPKDEDVTPVAVYFGFTTFITFIGLLLHLKFTTTELYLNVSEGFTSAFEDLSEEAQIALMRASKPIGTPKRGMRELIAVFKQTWHYLGMMLIACIQLNMVYPGVTFKKPVPALDHQTKTVTMITTFSVFYILGKWLGQFRKFYNVRTVSFTVIFRFLLFAFFIIQAVTIDIPVLNTAMFGYLNIALFAISMGFVNVAIFIMAPEEVEPEKKEVAGFLAVFSISVGAMVGGLLALALKNIGFNDHSSSAAE